MTDSVAPIKTASTGLLSLDTVIFPQPDNSKCPITEPHVIIFADGDKDLVFAMNLALNIKPEVFSYSELLSFIDEGIVIEGELKRPDYMKLPDSMISITQLKNRDNKMAIIGPVIENIEEFIQKPYGKSFAKDSKKGEKKYHRTSLYRDLYRYWRSGSIPNAFLRKLGSGTTIDKVYKTKPGPNSHTGKISTKKDKKNIERALNKLYRQSPPMYLSEVYQSCLDYYYSDKIFNTETQKTSYDRWDECDLISEWQFMDHARVYLKRNKVKTLKDQGIHTEFVKNQAGLSGDLASYYDKGPGYYYQVDESPFDTELVCQFDPTRQKRVGKPTVYVVRDMSSRSFVGLYITFKNPSADTARAIIFSAFRNKKKFCKELGIEISDDDWNMQDKSRNIMADNGEIKAELARCFSKDSHVTVHFNKEGYSHNKGLVERAFRLLHDAVKGRVEGYSPNNVPPHIKKLLRQRASLNINELYQILITYIIIYNNYAINDGIELSKEMYKSNVQQIPREAWDWGRRFRAGYLKPCDETELYGNLLEVGEVTCHKKHINFVLYGLKYKCEWLRLNGYQDRKKVGNIAPKFRCRFMRHSLSYILIETKEGFQVATLIGDLFKGVSVEDAEREIEIINVKNTRQKKLHREKQSQTRSLIEDLGREAKKEQVKINVNQANTQDLSANRREEIDHETKSDENRFKAFISEKYDEVHIDPDNSPEKDDKTQNITQKATDRAQRIRERRSKNKDKGEKQ